MSERCEPDILAKGKQFHRQVQAAYVAGLPGVKLEDVKERPIVQPSGRRERADSLLLVSQEPERQRFVMEIKSTDWSKPERSEAARRRLFLRHLRGPVHGEALCEIPHGSASAGTPVPPPRLQHP